jgi:hypothetical protein
MNECINEDDDEEHHRVLFTCFITSFQSNGDNSRPAHPEKEPDGRDFFVIFPGLLADLRDGTIIKTGFSGSGSSRMTPP